MNSTMGRKRKSVPQKANTTKRQAMTWNMFDHDADLYILDDNDPNVRKEGDAPKPGPSGDGNTSVRSEWGALDIGLQNRIDESDFYLTVTKVLQVKPEEWKCLLGKIDFLLNTNVPKKFPQNFPESDEFWIYAHPEGRHTVYFEMEKDDGSMSVLSYNASTGASMECLDGLQLKAFPLAIAGYDVMTGILSVNVYVTEAALTKLKFSCEAWKAKKTNIAVQEIMAHFYGTITKGRTQLNDDSPMYC